MGGGLQNRPGGSGRGRNKLAQGREEKRSDEHQGQDGGDGAQVGIVAATDRGGGFG